VRKLIYVLVICGSFLPRAAQAQYGSVSGTVDTGEVVPVRVNEDITASKADGRIFTGTVDTDVKDTTGRVAIPAGSPVELTARSSGDALALDLDSLTVNGQRYAVRASSESTASNQQGIGANKKTAVYVGGGALLGSILGAVVGGGKGAAVGAAAGAAAGAGTQIVTQGKSISVPRNSVVTFRLDRPLDVGVADTGVSLNGHHYHRY
jgi:hypothetical protein